MKRIMTPQPGELAQLAALLHTFNETSMWGYLSGALFFKAYDWKRIYHERGSEVLCTMEFIGIQDVIDRGPYPTALWDVLERSTLERVEAKPEETWRDRPPLL